LSEICLKFDATIYMKHTNDINANLPQTYTTECRCGIFLRHGAHRVHIATLR